MTRPALQPLLFPEPADADARFAAFHAAHPEVYFAFRRFAVEWKRRGHGRGSAQQILERVRWESIANAERVGGFKFDNRWRTCYARLLVAEMPEFEGFFEFRVQRRSA